MAIPNTVVLVNSTNKAQLFEFGYVVPANGTKSIDMTALTCYRREKLWAAIQYTILGSVIALQ